MRTLLALGIGPLVAMTLAGCGEDDPVADPGTAPPSSSGGTSDAGGLELDGREFVSTAVDGHRLVKGTSIRLTFDGTKFGASGGCNSFGSTWSLDGDVLRIEQLAGTEMACGPSRMDQDTWLTTFLTSAPTMALDTDTLTLRGDDATITLVDREVVEPDRELEGTTWVLEGVIDGDAVSSVTAGLRVPTIDFLDGELRLDTGCNTGGGRYEVDGDTMTIGPIRLTRMACAEQAGNELERAVVTTLEGSPTFTLEADVLTIVNGDAGLAYRAMGAGPPATGDTEG